MLQCVIKLQDKAAKLFRYKFQIVNFTLKIWSSLMMLFILLGALNQDLSYSLTLRQRGLKTILQVAAKQSLFLLTFLFSFLECMVQFPRFRKFLLQMELFYNRWVRLAQILTINTYTRETQEHYLSALVDIFSLWTQLI